MSGIKDPGSSLRIKDDERRMEEKGIWRVESEKNEREGRRAERDVKEGVREEVGVTVTFT